MPVKPRTWCLRKGGAIANHCAVVNWLCSLCIIDLPWLSLLVRQFSPCEDFLVFLRSFPSFPEIFGVRYGQKSFFGGLSSLPTKETRKVRTSNSLQGERRIATALEKNYGECPGMPFSKEKRQENGTENKKTTKAVKYYGFGRRTIFSTEREVWEGAKPSHPRGPQDCKNLERQSWKNQAFKTEWEFNREWFIHSEPSPPLWLQENKARNWKFQSRMIGKSCTGLVCTGSEWNSPFLQQIAVVCPCPLGEEEKSEEKRKKEKKNEEKRKKLRKKCVKTLRPHVHQPH